MKIPKVITKNGKQYIFEKEYKNFIMYKDMLTGVRECFHRQELGLAKEMVKPPVYLNLTRIKW